MTAVALRAAPAFAVYASDDLARTAWYGLTAGERGLLESMSRVYWVEHRLPRDPRLLALACRLPADVGALLTPAVLAHFEPDAANPDVLHHVELRRQLDNIARTRELQSIGGKRGASTANAKRVAKPKRKLGAASNGATGQGAGTPAGTPAGQVRVPERTELKELNSTSSLKSGDRLVVDDSWVKDYVAAETETTADAYRKASGR